MSSEQLSSASHKPLRFTNICLSIDHLYAVDLIDRVHKAGGKIRSFKSFCGGLPAPESMTRHEQNEFRF